MHTRVSVIFGPMFMAIGLCVAMQVPDGWVGPTLATFLNTVPYWLWGALNMLVGFSLAHPSMFLRRVRICAGSCMAMGWVGVAIWPAFPGVNTSAHPSIVGTLAWLAISSMILFDIYHSMFRPEWQRFREMKD